MTGISYFIIHLLAMTLPGWIITRLTGLGPARLIFVFACSYIYFVLLASLSKWLHLPLTTFYIFYALPLIIMVVVSLWIRADSRHPRESSHWLIGLFIVVFSYLLYRFVVGPYNEVPADLFRHLEYARSQLNTIEDGFLGRQRDLIPLLKQQGGIWYSFYALITSFTGLAPGQTLPWATLANSLVFLVSVYCFAWYIFRYFTLSNTAQLAAALLATLFMATHLGVSVFAYLRYYAFAPTILNMVIYFASIIAMLELLKWQVHRIQYILFTLCAVLASILVHSQEGLFILIIGSLMLAWFALYPKKWNPSPVSQIRSTSTTAYRVLLVLIVLGFFALVIWAYSSLNRPDLAYNKVLQLSQQGPIFNRILFLNPTYQGIQTITLWGLFVYFLFIIYWRKFFGHPYLFSGMLVPFLTVFNPLFVDWFLRVEGVHTLWRMLYMVPLHFVAAMLVVFLISSATNASEIWRKSLSYLSIAFLFVLLFPLYGINANSRQTLVRVDFDASYLYWQDLIDYLNQTQKEPLSILTDPVTAYLIKGLTQHRTYQFKFSDSGRQRFNFEDYSAAPLEKYKGWLLIVNDRNGGYSDTGKSSRHWPADILNTSNFYRTPLREHIKSNPENRFEEIWVQDDIRVYKIR
jgi:hypothetical protein